MSDDLSIPPVEIAETSEAPVESKSTRRKSCKGCGRKVPVGGFKKKDPNNWSKFVKENFSKIKADKQLKTREVFSELASAWKASK